ncbi:MAG TPA: HD-GYP domain-containing protein [Synergistaceae bacterium]|nr:HD-GYP domain-containing protein [Synergistaceae bacterium]HQF92164.1 HD-GYP domain-containing protein [Synergistaceae bacterium]HQH78092.1 HD-GYP domain-containing protein [Synergistaceae bacterium]HQK25554.1 HD-GYP domain-containing protein [Synergistaceae bacterium]
MVALVSMAVCFAGVATLMVALGVAFLHGKDREEALEFVATFLRDSLERRFDALQEGFFSWGSMERALREGDWPFIEEEIHAMARGHGVARVVFSHQGQEIYRAGPLIGDEPPFGGSAGGREGFFLEGRPLIRQRLPVMDDKSRYHGYTALVTVEVSRIFQPFASFLGHRPRIVPPSPGSVPLGPGLALEVEGGDSHLWALGGMFFFGALGAALMMQPFFRRRDLAAHLMALSSVLAQRDAYTADHSERVGRYALRIARGMKMGRRAQGGLYEAARLHDLGKVLIPDAILLKPGPLTPEEFDVIKEHPAKGADMVFAILERRELAAIIRGHHERWDGSGYPDGLAGEAIPLEARILAVADIIDAMSTARPYHPPRKAEEVRNFLLAEGGKLFDPAVVDAALEALPELQLMGIPRKPLRPRSAEERGNHVLG